MLHLDRKTSTLSTKQVLIEDFLGNISIVDVLSRVSYDVDEQYESECEEPSPDISVEEWGEVEEKIKNGTINVPEQELADKAKEAEEKIYDICVQGVKRLVQYCYYHLASLGEQLTKDDIAFIVENSIKRFPGEYQEFIEQLPWDLHCAEFYWDIFVSQDSKGNIEDEPLEVIAIDAVANKQEDAEIIKSVAALQKYIREKLQKVPIQYRESVEGRAEELMDEVTSFVDMFSDFEAFETTLLNEVAELVHQFPTTLMSFIDKNEQSPLYRHSRKYLPLIAKYKLQIQKSNKMPFKVHKTSTPDDILHSLIVSNLSDQAEQIVGRFTGKPSRALA